MIQNQGEQDCSNCGFQWKEGPTKELYNGRHGRYANSSSNKRESQDGPAAQGDRKRSKSPPARKSLAAGNSRWRAAPGDTTRRLVLAAFVPCFPFAPPRSHATSTLVFQSRNERGGVTDQHRTDGVGRIPLNPSCVYSARAEPARSTRPLVSANYDPLMVTLRSG